MTESISQINDVLAANRTGCTVEPARNGGFDLYRGSEHLQYCSPETSSATLVAVIRNADRAETSGECRGQSYGEIFKSMFVTSAGWTAGSMAVHIGAGVIGGFLLGGDD